MEDGLADIVDGLYNLMVAFTGGVSGLPGSKPAFVKLGIGGSGLSLIFPAVLAEGARTEPGAELCAAIGGSTAVEDMKETVNGGAQKVGQGLFDGRDISYRGGWQDMEKSRNEKCLIGRSDGLRRDGGGAWVITSGGWGIITITKSANARKDLPQTVSVQGYTSVHFPPQKPSDCCQ